MIRTVVEVLCVLAVLVLSYRLGRRRGLLHPESDAESTRGLPETHGVGLASQIFNSADYFWLKRIGFPDLAERLQYDRQELAMRWLKALRKAVNDLVRTAQPLTPGAQPSDSGWRVLFLTLRFHLLLSYAQAVVYLFGPYHSLVPSLSWTRILWPSPKTPVHFAGLDGGTHS